MELDILGWGIALAGLVFAIMMVVGAIRDKITGREGFDTCYCAVMFLMCVIYLLIITACIK